MTTNLIAMQVSQEQVDLLRTISATAVVIAVPLVVAIIVNSFVAGRRNKELALNYLALAVEILRAEQSDRNGPLREWAVDTIDHYSEVPLTADARQDMLAGVIRPISASTVNPKNQRGRLDRAFGKDLTWQLDDVEQRLMNMK